jgi:uncharacterized protein with NAD-binding domain and iron-sulfur cluster
MSKKVVILGGGVAGMSAAHELIDRGYQVEVFEKNPIYVGGKARSIDYYGDENTPYQNPLPGEHGFRFFPGFYKHVTQTMKRIPYGEGSNCFENLVPSKTAMMASFGKPELLTLVNFPKSLGDLEIMLDTFIEASKVTGLEPGDTKFFASKLWELATCSGIRRHVEYETISWWNYMDADNRSKAYQDYFVSGLTRTLVAAKANEVSTKTGGNILLQLIFLMMNPKAHADRVLNKPTNDAWLFPWKDYLNQKGVVYHHNAVAKSIDLKDGLINSATVTFGDDKEDLIVTADYFISCLPVERMNQLLTPEIIKTAPSMAGIPELSTDVSWMTGIQFYLSEDVKLNFGHTIYTDSPWALTSISQLQFWKDYNINDKGNGKVRGILSVDISDWFTPGLNGKLASDCTNKEDIKNEVWEELKLSLNDSGSIVLTDDMLIDYYLDRDIRFNPLTKTTNEEPLLVNKINTWKLRPEAQTEIKNLKLASDYVRTYTDLATMEGANEAARRAVNSLLENEKYKGELCGVWPMKEPDLLRVYRWYDEKRFKKGLPWGGSDLPFLYKVLNILNGIWVIVREFFKNIF